MPSKVSPRTIGLFQRAQIARAFPAYKLHELSDIPAAELLRALELLNAAVKIQS